METTNSIEGKTTTQVVSFSAYKSNRAKEIELESLENYLSVLSFNQLVNEAYLLIDELKRSPFDSNLNQTSLVLLKELKNRINKENPDFAVNGNAMDAFQSLLKKF